MQMETCMEMFTIVLIHRVTSTRKWISRLWFSWLGLMLAIIINRL